MELFCENLFVLNDDGDVGFRRTVLMKIGDILEHGFKKGRLSLPINCGGGGPYWLMFLKIPVSSWLLLSGTLKG